MHQGKIFITGGAGFIGSQVNALLQKQGYETLVYDNLYSGNTKSVIHGIFIKGDIGDLAKLEQIFESEKILCVMHFAAYTDVGESVVDPLKYYQNNVANTLILLKAMQKHQVKNLIFSSSAAVYGLPQKETIQESDLCFPINPYGESKLMVEKILKDLENTSDFKTCSLRYFNAAGGDPDGLIKYWPTYEHNLIPKVLSSIQARTELTINGTDYPTRDGTCVRDYIHVADLGEAHILAMKKMLKEGCSSCYNLGNGQGFSIREVIAAAEKVTGNKVIVKEGQRRAGDPPTLLADAAKAHAELGWQPRYPSLDSIIEHAWKARK